MFSIYLSPSQLWIWWSLAWSSLCHRCKMMKQTDFDFFLKSIYRRRKNRHLIFDQRNFAFPSIWCFMIFDIMKCQLGSKELIKESSLLPECNLYTILLASQLMEWVYTIPFPELLALSIISLCLFSCFCLIQLKFQESQIDPTLGVALIVTLLWRYEALFA